MVPLERVAASIVHVATHPDMKTSGYVWMLPDDQPLLRLDREQLREGVYKLIDERLKERLR
jgi:exonuclease I